MTVAEGVESPEQVASLRQFLQNGNAIVGAASSLFRIPTADPGFDGGGNGAWLLLNLDVLRHREVGGGFQRATLEALVGLLARALGRLTNLLLPRRRELAHEVELYLSGQTVRKDKTTSGAGAPRARATRRGGGGSAPRPRHLVILSLRAG